MSAVSASPGLLGESGMEVLDALYGNADVIRSAGMGKPARAMWKALVTESPASLRHDRATCSSPVTKSALPEGNSIRK